MERILPPKFWIDACYDSKKKKKYLYIEKVHRDAFEVKLDKN